MKPAAPRHGERVVIENVVPSVDCGRFAIKRVVGETVVVRADVFADGHDVVVSVLGYRRETERTWSEVPMRHLGNDRWEASFVVDREGAWQYTVSGWVDPLRSWRRDLLKRTDPDDIALAAKAGAELATRAARSAGDKAKKARIQKWAKSLADATATQALELAKNETLFALAAASGPRIGASTLSEPLRVTVDRTRARFSAWYELFPRSFAPAPGAHGTFLDVQSRLDYIAGMGFDVLYLTPIHPIGSLKRKGRNNSVQSDETDVGSPWAIGSAEGGHTAIHPQLGTLEDFKRLVSETQYRGMEIALDIALQVAPDHPYVTAHPDWFEHRPDGSIRYAENPPKKYEDIYPIDFETGDREALWLELLDIFRYWIAQGVRIFRVDNPHTKPFAFWEWVIAAIKSECPDVLFLAEAFTRPKVMHRLAKLGFTQSYTYFTWRNTKAELIEYFTELAHDDSHDYFRPNCWPNTPDILPVSLRNAAPAAFHLRLVLAATLAANYGIYGPAFELMENQSVAPGSEEYLHSEKYELRRWDLDRADSLAPLIRQVNGIRNQCSALQTNDTLHFHAIDNDQLICYSKTAPDDTILVVVNLDPRFVQSGWVSLDLGVLGLDPSDAFDVEDLLAGVSYPWQGPRNFVKLDPALAPAHIFSVRRRAPVALTSA